MPLYDYRCATCGKVTEIRHGFNETNSAPCPRCGGALARVFNPAPIIFNGSGFYKTDSRPAQKTSDAKSEPPKSDAPKADAPKSDAPKSDSAA
ncbi:MAG TPA: FmdB family zinc ribbon protein [Candidatus Acidoferrum sp.]|nr:FmdB family zinc ribbon protein [Candidatus Acidoferrum sp.]